MKYIISYILVSFLFFIPFSSLNAHDQIESDNICFLVPSEIWILICFNSNNKKNIKLISKYFYDIIINNTHEIIINKKCQNNLINIDKLLLKYPNLIKLCLNDLNYLSHLDNLTNFKTMSIVSLSSSNISSEYLKKFILLTDLQYLDLKHCQGLNDECLKNLTSLTKLKYILKDK